MFALSVDSGHGCFVLFWFVCLFVCLFGVLRVHSSYIKSMYSHQAALWSLHYDDRDRITHQPRTKQRGNGQPQRSPDSWTWEEILDGKGPWVQPGEYRRPKAELEAAKAERRWSEAATRQRWTPDKTGELQAPCSTN